MKRRFLFPGVPTVVVPGHAKSLHRTCPKCGQRMAWSPEWERDRWICVNCNAVHYEGQYEPNRDRFLQLIDGFAKLDAGEQVEVAADLGKTAKPEWKTVLMDIVRENQRPRILFLMLILLGLLLCAGIKALTTLPTFPEWMVNFTPFWFIVIVVPFLIVANITYIVPRRRRQMATNLLFSQCGPESLGLLARYALEFEPRSEAEKKFFEIGDSISAEECDQLTGQDRTAIANLLRPADWGPMPSWRAIRTAIRILAMTDYQPAIPILRALVGRQSLIWKHYEPPSEVRAAVRPCIVEIERRCSTANENARLLRAAIKGDQDRDTLLRTPSQEPEAETLLRSAGTDEP